MFMDTPDTLMYVAIGAFVLGWLVAKISAALAGKIQAKKRDPRDDRIRSLEAEVRIAESNAAKAGDELEKVKERGEDLEKRVADRDLAIASQSEKIERLKADLKESVMKTRELRSELSARAEESVRSEVKLREVETELSVAQASTDLLATGVLDYSVAPEKEEQDAPASAEQAKAAT
jgi:chromosome segregation ATPase